MYDFKKIEQKWQTYWKEHNTFEAKNGSEKKKYYILVEFPYPSGAGLHVGHVRSYTALDALARKRRMEGYNVLFPMGWDAFGAPAEQYAIANHIHPKDAVQENIKTFKGQIQTIGISFDWNREFATTDADYYKWTQWQFLKFYEHGLAYKAKKPINWCPKCKTGLSNEDSSGGVCERCGTPVVQKEKEQWMLRMSDYAEQLLDGLDDTKFQDRTKIAQRNWIGKSTGAEVEFKVADTDETLTVFTTRPDTLYGVTFMVVAPEHPMIETLKDRIQNMDEVRAYQDEARHKSAFERTELVKDKTGVCLEGLKAINPLNDTEIPIYISDYVMMGYGTGAIMAVPAHDDRDYAFARKFDIPIIEVIKGGNIEEAAYTGDGEMVNSGILNGMTNKKDSIAKMIEYLEEKKIGRKKVNYKLQDWIFSRQRFWGEPIPMIYCEDCGWVPVPEKDLPVLLPDVANYEPTDNGESPLAAITDWVNTPCPHCGKMARRETDTMPNWAGSSWYWLRYMDAHNDKEFVSMDAMKYWGKVDWYNGGMEHATRHLLYARFWNQFLYNIGLVPNKEPFEIRTSHGMILGDNGEKMSKSKGNVVNPNEIVENYGADALRTYEMFIGDYEKEAAWSTNGLKGCKRFLDRVWKLQDCLNDKDGYTDEVLINQTIRKVTNDLETMKYNTAVSALMILVNRLEEAKTITRNDLRTLIHLLNPIAPHITEEMNELCELGTPLCESAWPTYDESKCESETFTMVVQVNGKVRGKIETGSDTTKEEMEKLAREIDNVKAHIEGKEIVKTIVVPKKLVNIVVK
ncbi:MAG TPA: leucine--tRNA ligase [Candidatus Fimihabitans intestinipullorum]|uniref:Leucine--tRNA ligase n=1 Tax=Candidatus Fimihabitans intestinipullorum TaxID=2840820 RepID=A0A9D1HV70_9BACT|nr:leucine--tRNA ligase [Candidatus Fimihabitans intestinipullorum]